jgi:DNA repair photolyase
MMSSGAGMTVETLQNKVKGLFEPKSPLPGNGISRAETKRPKRLRRFKEAVGEKKSR